MSEYIVDANDSSEMYAVEMGRYEELREVIRCKDCKFADVYYHGFQATDMFTRVCKKLVRHVETDGFCAWAERKEE